MGLPGRQVARPATGATTVGAEGLGRAQQARLPQSATLGYHRAKAAGLRMPSAWPDPDGRRHGPLRAHAEVSRSRAVLGTQKGGGPKDLALSLEGSGPEYHAAVA